MANLETLSLDFTRILVANDTGTSFTLPVQLADRPTATVGYIELRRPKDNRTNNAVMLMFFGVGNDNVTFDVRIFGVKKIDRKTRPASTEPPHDQWVHLLLADLSCTVSAAVGLANGPVLDTERYVDTFTLNDGNDDVSIDVQSPEEDMAGHVILDTKGCEFLYFDWDMTGATSANGLICEL